MIAAILLSLVGAHGAIVPLQAQSDDAPILSFSDAVDVRWVHISAVVRAEDELTAELTLADFELLIDGRSVPIETFEHHTETPLSIAYLQDLSGSMNSLGKLDLSRRAFEQLLDEARARDEYSIVSFAGEKVLVEVPFSSDQALLRKTSMEWQALGTTGLYDAVTWLPEVSLGGKRNKRAAVVVTDGLDNTSKITPEDSRAKVLRTQLPVYVLDLSKFGHQRVRPADAKDPSWPLRRLALGTGGRYYRPLDREDLARDAHNISQEIRLQYVLGFAADASKPMAEHTIEILVHGKNNIPRYRPDYFGPPPASFASYD